MVLWTGLSAWFVADDFWYVVYVEQVETPWSSFLFPQFGELCFKPITFVLSYYLDRALSMSPWAIHLSSLFLHVVNVALVFSLVYVSFRRADQRENKDAGSRPSEEDKRPVPRDPAYPALAAAFIFAVHPVAELTATWYSCRADLLGTMFSLAALICVAAPEKPRRRGLVLSGLLALLAMLSKAPYMTIFISAFLLRLFIEPERKWRGKLKAALAFSLPLFNAFVIYLCWRLLVLRCLGGYVPLSDSLAALWSQAEHHVPVVLDRVFRDFLVHHLPKGHVYVKALAAAGGVLVIAGGAGALLRSKRVLVFGVLFSLVSVIPLWNLSHMLAQRESRLIYLALAGFAIVVAALVHGPRNRALRMLGLAAVLTVCTVYGLYSKQELEDWKRHSMQNKQLADTIAGFLERKTPQSSGDRVYVLGLEADHYYLDAMVKTRLSLNLQDKLILSGEHPVFVFMNKGLKERIPEPKNLPEKALPGYEEHPADPSMVFKTALPPDLLAAVHFDPQSRVIEVRDDKVKDLTKKLRKRFHLRRSLHRRGRLFTFELPSFNFTRTPMGFPWEPSGEVEVREPESPEAPYRLISRGPGFRLISPEVSFHALYPARAALKMRIEKKDYLPPGQRQGCLFWQGKKEKKFSEKNKICFDLTPDGKVHTYELDLDESIRWARTNRIKRLRLDPVYFPARLDLYWLEFLPRKK
ncbi:MAG: hypothetical protein R6V10_16400 [bacterium]